MGIKRQKNLIKDNHSLNNIREDLRLGKMRELENVQLVRVFSDTPFGLGGEYDWFECPAKGDYEKGKDGEFVYYTDDDGDFVLVENPVTKKKEKVKIPIFSALVPAYLADTYLPTRQASPSTHTQEMADREGLAFFEFEPYTCNMWLTIHEAARFEQDFDGECDIMRSISTPIKIQDEATGEWVVKRIGIHDVVKEASGGDTALTVEKIGGQKFPLGLYEGTFMKDIPLDYITKGSHLGGLGFRDANIQNMCIKELERRNSKTKKEITYCIGTTKSGKQCSVAVTSGEYCHQHVPKGVTADV